MNIKKSLAAIGIATIVAATPASACWSPRAVEAAQVRDFETMLMVATLRCRTKDVSIGEDYNRFVREKRAILTAVNDELRSQFVPGRSGRDALEAYDRFVTAIANTHGGGTPGQECADFHNMLNAALTAETARGALLDLAVRAGSDPALPEERCMAQIALLQH
jgi:hypothetical protein